ncbi:MAG: quinolinate synthase NadA, partial [Planctomycetota bacterium]
EADEIAHWPGGEQSIAFSLEGADRDTRDRFDRARLILFGSSCGVHTVFEPWMAEHWRARGYGVTVHPECPRQVVEAADHHGSTAFLWNHVLEDRDGTARYAVGTESHFVANLRLACRARGIDVVSLSEAERPDGSGAGIGCGCATMSRNDPPHLVGLLDLLRQGRPPHINEVLPGDVVDERTARRDRLDQAGQDWVRENARRALDGMIEITRAGAPVKEAVP